MADTIAVLSKDAMSLQRQALRRSLREMNDDYGDENKHPIGFPSRVYFTITSTVLNSRGRYTGHKIDYVPDEDLNGSGSATAYINDKDDDGNYIIVDVIPPPFGKTLSLNTMYEGEVIGVTDKQLYPIVRTSCFDQVPTSTNNDVYFYGNGVILSTGVPIVSVVPVGLSSDDGPGPSYGPFGSTLQMSIPPGQKIRGTFTVTWTEQGSSPSTNSPIKQCDNTYKMMNLSNGDTLGYLSQPGGSGSFIPWYINGDATLATGPGCMTFTAQGIFVSRRNVTSSLQYCGVGIEYGPTFYTSNRTITQLVSWSANYVYSTH